MVQQTYELTIPVEVFENGLVELPQGVRTTLEGSVRSWKSKRMTAGELESLLQSFASLSPTLRQYFDAVPSMKSAAEPEAFEVLSDDDILALLADSQGPGSQGPTKKLRVSEQHCNEFAQEELSERRPQVHNQSPAGCICEGDMPGHMSREGKRNKETVKTERANSVGLSPTREVSSGPALKKSVSINNFDYLSLTDSDGSIADSLHEDANDVRVAFASLQWQSKI